jgi:hypothetical protein
MNDEPATDALLEMSTALLSALEARNEEMDLAGHAQRVADLADRLAARHGITDSARAALRQAALLHEIGMIGVPAELLNKQEPLTAEELARVHAHAEVGAAVARAVAGELAATLIRHQYDDEATLRQALGEGTEAYQLTLLLRAADVADVVSRARTVDGTVEHGLRFVARDAAALEAEALAA